MLGQTLDQQVTDDPGLVAIEPWMLVLVAVVLVVSLLGAQLYRRYMA